MNHYPTDSLGRRMGVLADFSSLTPASCQQLIEELGLSMTVSELMFCAQYYGKHKERHPTMSELYLLDEIIKAPKPLHTSVGVGKLSIYDRDIAETYRDLMEKCQVLGSPKRSLTFEENASVASMYLSRIGIPETDVTIDKDTQSHKTDFVPGSALLLINETDPTSLSLHTDDGVQHLANIDPRGLLYTISSLMCGCLVDLSRLSCGEAPIELSHLATEWHGLTLAVVDPTHADAAQAKLNDTGVSTIFFGTTSSSDRIKLITPLFGQFELSQQFIYTLGNSIRECEMTVAHEDMTAVDSMTVSKHDGTVTVMADCHNGRYATAIHASIHAILYTLANGADRSSLSLAYRFGLPREHDVNSLSAALAEILGSYRISMELCPQLEKTRFYSESSPSMEVTASTKPTKPLLHVLEDEPAYITLLTFKRTATGHVDFADFRAMCDTVHSLYSSPELMGAIACTEILGDTLKELCQNGTFTPTKETLDISASHVLGILLASVRPLSYGMILGTYSPAIKEAR